MTYPIPGGEYVVTFVAGGKPVSVVFDNGPPTSLVGNNIGFNVAADVGLYQLGMVDTTAAQTSAFTLTSSGNAWGPAAGAQPGDSTDTFWTCVGAGDKLFTPVDDYVAAGSTPSTHMLYNMSFSNFALTTSAPTSSTLTVGIGTLADYLPDGVFFIGSANGIATAQNIGWRVQGSGNPLTMINNCPGPTQVVSGLAGGTTYDFFLFYTNGTDTSDAVAAGSGTTAAAAWQITPNLIIA